MRTSDIYDDRGEEVNSIALNFQNFGGKEFFQGPARTVSVFQDNGLLKDIMRRPGDGAVLVVDGFGSLACTLLGGNMAKIFLENGWAGVVINGAIRDRDELADIPFGVLALGSNPKRSRKAGVGQEGLVLSVGGASIRPGVMIYADSDGVLVEF
ncbi:ribonuclease E activity regulator RraA [Corynebacterium sp. A21]|uniref:ribonuclease E activity regulator RraA n=1 Tax=Corynebacterium sp. A21 TaxID=3457318 RepID=UPI003FD59655